MKPGPRPDWLDPAPWVRLAARATPAAVEAALAASAPGLREFAALLSPAAAGRLEALALRARQLTRRHFGRTLALYVPLYLSNYCTGGCVYCGFAADRRQPRHKLGPRALAAELEALRAQGFDDVLLLTGERTPAVGFDYVRRCVAAAARRFHAVGIESFAMTTDEYRSLTEAGCTSVTLYQETYDAVAYETLHRWGPKRDYADRLAAPARALEGGIRYVGLGALLGLAEPLADAVALFQHAAHLRRAHWQGGVLLSFPRMRPQLGGYAPAHPVSDAQLAQLIWAFRICLPDVPLVLSTRECAALRDGLAGVGISRMSAASRTTVGGYAAGAAATAGQFDVNDDRAVAPFCAMLRARGLEPVFKNWDAVFRPGVKTPAAAGCRAGGSARNPATGGGKQTGAAGYRTRPSAAARPAPRSS